MKRSRVTQIEKIWLSGKELQDYIGLGNKQIQRLRDEGKIPFSRIGQKTFIYEKQKIDQFIQNQKVI